MWAVGKLYRRPNFGRFLHLENIKYKILQAAKRKEETFPDLVISYLSAAFCFPKKLLQNLRWDFILALFFLVASISVPKNIIPLLRMTKDANKTEPWDYEGRVKYLQIHTIAQKYGWSEQQINKLDVDTAFALIQEILTDEQLDREFLWTMSERSYIYDYKTKTGKPNPLERPYFMKEEVKPPQKTVIPSSLMPVGNVSYKAFSDDYKPKPHTGMTGL